MIFTGRNENMMITENFLYVITKNCILKYKDNVIIESVQISSYMYVKKFKEQWYMYLDFNVYKINDINGFYDFLKEAEDKFDYSFLNNFIFSKTERREDVIFIDFYIFDEKTFFIYKVKDKYLLFRDNEELLSFFKLKYTFFEEYFFLVEDFHLKKVNLQNMQKEVIKSNVSVNYLFANDDIVLFSSKNGSISIMRGKEMISFHKHASCLKEIIYIDDILYIITEDHKFSIVELNRSSRYDVFSFYGVFKKMYLYFNSIFILTELEIIKYNLRSGSVESWEFSIPKSGSIKCYTKDHDDYYEDVLNEYKMKNFKAEIEAIYQRIDESKYQVGGDIYYKDLKGKVIDYSLVLRYKAFIFVYDSHIKYIFNIPKRELYYSNGHLFAFKAKKNRKVLIDIYKIIDNKLLYITHKETKIHKLPEDVFYVNGNMFFLIDGKLWKNCIFIANILVLDNVKIIKESEKGTFALNNKGIYALQNTSYIKKSKNINDFHYLKDDLFYLKNSKELFCNEDLILSNFSGHTFFVNSTSIKIFELKDDHSELSIYENKTKVENVILKCSVESFIRSDIAKTKDDLLYLIE